MGGTFEMSDNSNQGRAPPHSEPGETKRSPYWILQGRFGRAIVSAQGRALVAHAHSEFHVLFKLGGEDIDLCTPTGTLSLSDNRMICFNPWESHSVQPSDRGVSLNLVLEISQEWLALLLGTKVDSIQKLFPSSSGEVTPELRAQSAQMAAIVCRGVTMTEERCSSAMSELMKAVVRSHADIGLAGRHSVAGRAIDRRIRKAVQQIRERASENPRLEEIAADVGLSRSHFFQQFKLCVGVSPQHFLDWHRVALAIDLLCSSDTTVSNISHALGFSAPSHFTRFFMQHIGLSPSDYRRFSVSIC